MKPALLDTNFILTCIKQKIDFFEELEFMGLKILIPEEVIDELKKLKQSSALKLLEKNNFSKINLAGKNVDNSIINYSKKNPEILVATLDRELQKKLKNRKIIIRGKKKLEII
ncbi:MAG: PIN domain-containing protein [Nanoarchaeota archaeon]